MNHFIKTLIAISILVIGSERALAYEGFGTTTQGALSSPMGYGYGNGDQPG